MRALNYAVVKGVRLDMPLVINISIGNTYGSHDGTSLLETFISEDVYKRQLLAPEQKEAPVADADVADVDINAYVDAE